MPITPTPTLTPTGTQPVTPNVTPSNTPTAVLSDQPIIAVASDGKVWKINSSGKIDIGCHRQTDEGKKRVFYYSTNRFTTIDPSTIIDSDFDDGDFGNGGGFDDDDDIWKCICATCFYTHTSHLMKCKDCGDVRYCSIDCQKEDRSEHKKRCCKH